ncbi:G-type lectin S-receptor-like serine/threonine-protein kinase SD3-1 [Morus notabilis]|uniref:G-type lectin S-receptor-like serine/threonine-protein kinase SD3-1 n=1 Tax=Morus notabilis TaxID=981085 RepID=UPI000CED008F|nr:G-type lectin S-receptor-like serine/threonine-protein kinase SD3-1 [Morus notabilis]XP_024019124.1 G-type lectin S-receptor-like serine/threonine-protein kinase SD3-1 [Morus notabilis]
MLEQQNGYLLKWPFVLCLYVGLLWHSVVSQIPLGSKLSVSENNFWVSPNSYFAFGFFNISDQPNQYSVGIRFNSKLIPVDKQDVVWVVGADLTVGDSSYFQIKNDGDMVLVDSLKGVTVWTSKTSLLSVASAAVQDNGNFVLFTEKKNVVWQSFDLPSDTLLPGQNFSVLHTLRAASRNSMSSYYSLFMNASGQLQLRWDSHVTFWTSRSPSSSNVTALLMSNGALQIRDQRWKPIWSVFGEDHNDSIRFRYLRLDVDGNMRLYSWSEASRSWRTVWQAVENQCNVFATCGQHGICVFTESASPVCKCPFRLTNESIPRCLIPTPQLCKSGSNMLNYQHMFLYGMYPPNDDLVSGISSQECESLCLNDRLCTAATFTNDGTARCLLKKTPYLSGYADPSLSSVSFVKKCSDPMAVNPSIVTSSRDTKHKGPFELCVPCLLGAVSGTSVLFIMVQMVVLFLIFRRRRISLRRKASLGYAGANTNGLIVLSFSEIKDVTGNLEHQIGPTMFKGMLPNNQPVAVKDMKSTIEERKYRVAVSKLGSIYHKNLIKLEGYCCELNHRFLIYEYAENGSIQKYIEDPKLCKKLTWGKRVEICLSVARAICYLHTGCREFVSHGNLKCENVVLDEKFEAKVTEFGLHRVITETTSSSASSAERDVEDYGKMVLTIVSGSKGDEDLSHWVYKEWMEGNAPSVVDRRINGGVDLGELDRVLRIAFWCLQVDERMRPSVREVVKVLEGTLSVDPPPPPFASQRQPEEEESSDAGSEPDSRRF